MKISTCDGNKKIPELDDQKSHAPKKIAAPIAYKKLVKLVHSYIIHQSLN